MIKVPLKREAFFEESLTRARWVEFIKTADRFSMGPQCAEFEKVFSAWNGRKYGVLFNSGGSANLALIQALLNSERLHKGDCIAVSSVTWATNVMPIIQLGLHPILVDLEANSLNVGSFIPSGVKAYFVTNALGFCPPLHELKRECEAKNILLLEDNCESLGARGLDGKLSGTYGLASTFSFYIGHHMTTIEGGMVLTDNEAFADELRRVRSNGWNRDNGGQRGFQSDYEFHSLGYNLRPTEVTGFLGLTQMDHLSNSIEKRRQHYSELEAFRSRFDCFYSKEWLNTSLSSPFCMPFICDKPETRERARKIFHKLGIEVRPIISGNMGRQPYFKFLVGEQRLYNADLIHDRGFYCGIFPDMTSEDLALIKQAIEESAA